MGTSGGATIALNGDPRGYRLGPSVAARAAELSQLEGAVEAAKERLRANEKLLEQIAAQGVVPLAG